MKNIAIFMIKGVTPILFAFMSKSDLETSKQFGRQHNRVRRGGGRYFWKGWPVSLAGWLPLEKEGGRRRKKNRCDPYFH